MFLLIAFKYYIFFLSARDPFKAFHGIMFITDLENQTDRPSLKVLIGYMKGDLQKLNSLKKMTLDIFENDCHVLCIDIKIGFISNLL